MIFYHATFGAYIDSIKEKGILCRNDGNTNRSFDWDDEYPEYVFLATEDYLAGDIIAAGVDEDMLPEDVVNSDVYIVAVDINPDELELDNWMNQEADDEEWSFMYRGSISPDKITDIYFYE